MTNKVIASPRKMVADLIKGKTIDQALTEVNTPNTEGVSPMTNVNTFSAMNRFVGQPVLVYTVTFAFSGTLVAIENGMLILEDTAWLAELGRLHETLHSCGFSEVEYTGIPMVINSASIIFACALPSLPRTTK
jgi:hypothetical protein